MQRHPSLDDRFDPAIRIVDHDPAWRIDHIGSTAVPGLAAKPIIDLQLSVAAIHPIEPYAEPLKRLGYLFVAAPAFTDRQFFARPPERPRTHHLHVVASGSTHERRHLAVRDFLRAQPDEAAEYEALKRRLPGLRRSDKSFRAPSCLAWPCVVSARGREGQPIDARGQTPSYR